MNTAMTRSNAMIENPVTTWRAVAVSPSASPGGPNATSTRYSTPTAISGAITNAHSTIDGRRFISSLSAEDHGNATRCAAASIDLRHLATDAATRGECALVFAA